MLHGPARALLTINAREPKAVRRALAAERAVMVEMRRFHLDEGWRRFGPLHRYAVPLPR